MNATVHCTERLRECAATGAESAFEELVRCQVDLVYSAALRRCGGDAALAAEVSQTVFTELARRARSPRRTEAETVLTAVSLGGWLYHHTTFVAATSARANRHAVSSPDRLHRLVTRGSHPGRRHGRTA